MEPLIQLMVKRWAAKNEMMAVRIRWLRVIFGGVITSWVLFEASESHPKGSKSIQRLTWMRKVELYNVAHWLKNKLKNACPLLLHDMIIYSHEWNLDFSWSRMLSIGKQLHFSPRVQSSNLGMVSYSICVSFFFFSLCRLFFFF